MLTAKDYGSLRRRIIRLANRNLGFNRRNNKLGKFPKITDPQAVKRIAMSMRLKHCTFI